MEFENLLKLVKTVSDSSLTGFDYEENGVRISLRCDRMQGDTEPKNLLWPAAREEINVVTQEQESVREEGNLVLSPLVGTFYTAPAEGADPFVKVGDQVKKGQILGIVEAMKLMNDIECETDGQVVEILVKNEETVEYGQPLFRIV